eukprot:1224699-Rhodomonas_salina.1
MVVVRAVIGYKLPSLCCLAAVYCVFRVCAWFVPSVRVVCTECACGVHRAYVRACWVRGEQGAGGGQGSSRTCDGALASRGAKRLGDEGEGGGEELERR